MKDVKYDGLNGIGMIFYKRCLSFCQQKINQILGSVRCLHQCEIYLCLCILSDISKPSRPHRKAHGLIAVLRSDTHSRFPPAPLPSWRLSLSCSSSPQVTCGPHTKVKLLIKWKIIDQLKLKQPFSSIKIHLRWHWRDERNGGCSGVDGESGDRQGHLCLLCGRSSSSHQGG